MPTTNIYIYIYIYRNSVMLVYYKLYKQPVSPMPRCGDQEKW